MSRKQRRRSAASLLTHIRRTEHEKIWKKTNKHISKVHRSNSFFFYGNDRCLLHHAYRLGIVISISSYYECIHYSCSGVKSVMWEVWMKYFPQIEYNSTKPPITVEALLVAICSVNESRTFELKKFGEVVNACIFAKQQEIFESEFLSRFNTNWSQKMARGF